MQQPQPTLPFVPAIGFARNRETAPAYWMLDLLWLVLVDGHETGGAFSVMEQWMRQGSGPPVPHIHPTSAPRNRHVAMWKREQIDRADRIKSGWPPPFSRLVGACAGLYRLARVGM